MAKPTPRFVKEELARAKTAYLKNEDLRSLALLASALKGFVLSRPVGVDKEAIQTLFREVIANVNKMSDVQKLHKEELHYVKGKEKELYKVVVELHNKIEELQSIESYEAMIARKQKIDHEIIKGQKFLDEGNLPEAQRHFRNAVAEYVDEKGLFPLLAGKLIEKGHPKASMEYLKQGIAVSPENIRLYDFLLTAAAASKEYEPLEKILRDALKKVPDLPQVHEALSRVMAKF